MDGPDLADNLKAAIMMPGFEPAARSARAGL
jgi:hypothetical protein